MRAFQGRCRNYFFKQATNSRHKEEGGKNNAKAALSFSRRIGGAQAKSCDIELHSILPKGPHTKRHDVTAIKYTLIARIFFGSASYPPLAIKPFFRSFSPCMDLGLTQIYHLKSATFPVYTMPFKIRASNSPLWTLSAQRYRSGAHVTHLGRLAEGTCAIGAVD